MLRKKSTFHFRHGIKVAGFSGDGDGRILKSMRFCSNLNSHIYENKWFDNPTDSSICFLQDVVHIGTKLRNRLLDSVIFLTIGNKIASVSHLKILIDTVPKAVHGLVYSDVCPEDRQNFNSLEKIMQPHVREALARSVFGSEGTIEYIRICQEVTSSLYDDSLSPLERLSRIWRSTFFVRAWRLDVKRATKNGLNLDNNFLTRNAYQCIELNAKNLVILIRKFRNEGLSKFFHPSLFNSQPCEEIFRQLRSMGTINFTKVNFTLLELMHLIGRVDLMNDIMNFKLADVDVHFPRNSIRELNASRFMLPSDEEIKNTLKQALITAVLDARKFGMCIIASDIEKCTIKQVEVSIRTADQHSDETHIDLGIGSIDKNDDFFVGDYLRDYSNQNTEQSCSYVSVAAKDGQKIVRKSTVIWSASNAKDKLSSCRLRRVQTKKKSSSRQIEFADVASSEQLVKKRSEIQIGDWCFFQDSAEKDDDDDDDFSNIILGNILSFRYLNAKTKKEKQFSLNFCPISHEENSRNVEVLAEWHTVDKSGLLRYLKCSFICIESYIVNISRESIEKNMRGNICLSQKCTTSFQTFLKNESK